MQCECSQSFRLSLGVDRAHVRDSLFPLKLSCTYISCAVVANYEVDETYVEILHILASARSEVGRERVENNEILVRGVEKRLTQQGYHEEHQTDSVLVVSVCGVIFRLEH